MAKRTLGILAVAVATLLVAGCGTGSYTGTGLGTKIVANNAAGFNAESKKKAVLFYGELDVEMLMRTRPATKTPDRPTAPQPIRPKPQADDPDMDADLLDRTEIDIQTGHSLAWIDLLDEVTAIRADLAEQRAFLRQTPAFQIEEIHRLFDEEIDSLAPAAAKARETIWRNLTPAARLSAFKAKQREIADQWNEPTVGFDPLP